MNANKAIAFFSNKQIATQGLFSSNGKVHTGNNLDSFKTIFNSTIKNQITENNSQPNTKNNSIFSSQLTTASFKKTSNLKQLNSSNNQSKSDVSEPDKPSFQLIEIPQESITTDKNGRIQLNVASLSRELKQKLGIGEEKSTEIQAFNLTKEQLSSLIKQHDPTQEESQSNQEEENQFTQQRVFFAQFSPETTQSSWNYIKTNEEQENQPSLILHNINTNINTGKETENPLLHTAEITIASFPKEKNPIRNHEEENQIRKNQIPHLYKNDKQKDSVHFTSTESPDLEFPTFESHKNPKNIKIEKPVQADKGTEKYPQLEDKESTTSLQSNFWNFERSDNETLNSFVRNPSVADKENPIPLFESWQETTPDKGFSDLLSQAGDLDWQPWQQEIGQNNPVIPKRLYLFQVKEDPREDGHPNPKRVFLARSLPEISESQHDSTGTENNNSDKDDSKSFQEMVRRAEWEQRNVLTKLDSKSQPSDKSESLFKDNSVLADKPSKPVQSQKQDISLLQQQLGNNRDAVILEASNNSQSTPISQTGNRPDPPQLSHTNSGQSANSTLSNLTNTGTQTSETQTSMVQHYAEKVAEVQEAAARQIVRGVQGSIGSERSHITMRLVPESLGRIHIQMTMENGALTAQITALKEDTRVLLQQSVNSLRSAFEESGIKVDRLVINKDTLDLKQNDLGRQEESQDRSSKNRSSFEHRSGQNGQYNPGRQSRQQNVTWSDRMTTTDYFL